MKRSVRAYAVWTLVGLGLSAVGMLFAAAGFLTPTMGALGQEVIEVAVILNALRAARG